MSHVERKRVCFGVAMSDIHDRYNLVISARLERPAIFDEDVRIRDQFSIRSIRNSSEVRHEDSRPINLLEDRVENRWIAWDSLSILVQLKPLTQRFHNLDVRTKSFDGRFDSRLNQIPAFLWTAIALPRKENCIGHTSSVLDPTSGALYRAIPRGSEGKAFHFG